MDLWQYGLGITRILVSNRRHKFIDCSDKVKDYSWHGSEIQRGCCGSVEFSVGARDLESGGDEDVMHAGRLKDTIEA